VATKTPSDKTRIEAAIRELSALGVDIPYLLKSMLHDERKVSKLGKTKFKALFAAIRLPRGNVDDFFDFPLMSPSLWTFLKRVRLDILATKMDVDHEPFLRHPRRILDLFVAQIGLVHARRGAPTPRRHEVTEKRFRAALERLLWGALLGKESPERWVEIDRDLPSPAEVRIHQTRIGEYRRGRQGLSMEQAAGHVAKAWADELIAERDAEWENRRRKISN
jgi:hypothetical protein